MANPPPFSNIPRYAWWFINRDRLSFFVFTVFERTWRDKCTRWNAGIVEPVEWSIQVCYLCVHHFWVLCYTSLLSNLTLCTWDTHMHGHKLDGPFSSNIYMSLFCSFNPSKVDTPLIKCIVSFPVLLGTRLRLVLIRLSLISILACWWIVHL